MPGLRQQLRRMAAPKIAVSPIVGGQAIKGPAAKMMRELGQSISPLTVVDHFDGLLTGFVLDDMDAVLRNAVDLPTVVTNTLMTDLNSKINVAQQVLALGAELMTSGSSKIRRRSKAAS